MATTDSRPTQPASAAPPESESTINDPTLPEQRHAGKVGYGPNYRSGATLEDKISGLKEKVKGKITRNPDLVAHGRQVASGEERHKKLTGEDEPNPFATADDDEDADGDMHPASDPANPGDGSASSATAQDPSAPSAPPKATPRGMAVDEGHGTGAKEQAATVAPEGTAAAATQRVGGAGDAMKHIDARN